MIAIIDYGMGNLRSVQKALEKVGAKVCVTERLAEIEKAEKLVLPGVGAMRPAMEKLKMLKLLDSLKTSVTKGKPFLGICLGLQLLFEKSEEGGESEGLGIIPGCVRRFNPTSMAQDILKVPHMGWNQLAITQTSCPLFKGIADQTYLYFCHSYYCEPTDQAVTATRTRYGGDFLSALWKDNIFGVQFHPEKSQEAGLAILKNFQSL